MSKYFLLILIFASSLLPIQAQEIEKDIRSKISSLLKHEVNVDRKDTPGCLIGIIEVDTFFIIPFGKVAGSREAIMPDAIFDLGGLSKVFVSMVANHLLIKGVFRSDDQLLSDFPEFVDSELGTITFQNLLQHTSGIKKALLGLENETNSDGFVDETSFKRALEKTLLAKAGKFQYSHHNYTLLSMWLERRTGKMFPDLLDEFYADNPTSYRPEVFFGASEMTDMNPGLSRAGKIVACEDVGVQKYSLGMRSSLEEMIHWVQEFWLNEENDVVKLALSNRFDTEINRKIDFTQSFYVMGGEEDYTIYSHSGKSNRHSCAIHFVPETKTGIVIFSNSEIGTKDLSLLVLRMINYNWTRKADGQE